MLFIILSLAFVAHYVLGRVRRQNLQRESHRRMKQNYINGKEKDKEVETTEEDTEED